MQNQNQVEQYGAGNLPSQGMVFKKYAEESFLKFQDKSMEVDPPLNLDLNEIKALYIFSNFLNNGYVMSQGGYLGGTELSMGTLKALTGLAESLYSASPADYLYRMLIKRDPNSPKKDLLISDTAAKHATEEQSKTLGVPKGTLIWQHQYTARMHYDTFKATYTVQHEDKYMVKMHPVLWDQIVNNLATSNLNETLNTGFSDILTCFSCIPFLVDLRVRQLFFKKLKLTKDPHIHQAVDQLIMACFGEKIADNEKPILRWTIKLQCKTIRNLLERLGFPFKSTRLIRQFGICLASVNLDPSILQRMSILLIELQALKEKCGDRNQNSIYALEEEYKAAKQRLENPAGRPAVVLPAYVKVEEKSASTTQPAELGAALFRHDPHYKAFAVATTPLLTGDAPPKNNSQTYSVSTTSGEQPITITEKVNPKKELTSAVEKLPEALYDPAVDKRLQVLLNKIPNNPKGSFKKDKDFDHLVDLIRLVITQMDSLHQQRPDSPINVVEVFGQTYPLLISLYGAVQGYEVKFSPSLQSPPLPTQHHVENFKSLLKKYAPLVGYTDIEKAKALTEEATSRSLHHLAFPSLVGKKQH
jgi:hypothetical protein